MIYQAKKVLLFVVFTTLAFYSLLNLITSQTVSPLYSGIVNAERSSVVDYLQKIRKLQMFDAELEHFESVYGTPIISDVFKNELKRQNLVFDLKSRLALNPKSRDVLYGLSILYQQEGNENQYRHYFDLAKEVDPEIK